MRQSAATIIDIGVVPRPAERAGRRRGLVEHSRRRNGARRRQGQECGDLSHRLDRVDTTTENSSCRSPADTVGTCPNGQACIIQTTSAEMFDHRHRRAGERTAQPGPHADARRRRRTAPRPRTRTLPRAHGASTTRSRSPTKSRPSPRRTTWATDSPKVTTTNSVDFDASSTDSSRPSRAVRYCSVSWSSTPVTSCALPSPRCARTRRS